MCLKGEKSPSIWVSNTIEKLKIQMYSDVDLGGLEYYSATYVQQFHAIPSIIN